jgi:uncharacterized phage-like protein YoqJ
VKECRKDEKILMTGAINFEIKIMNYQRARDMMIKDLLEKKIRSL